LFDTVRLFAIAVATAILFIGLWL